MEVIMEGNLVIIVLVVKEHALQVVLKHVMVGAMGNVALIAAMIVC